MYKDVFKARYFAPGTWLISGVGCDCYLVEGEKEAVMIDAGYARANIQKFAQSLTDKPLRSVINTHSHFDHTGSNGYFEKVLCTEGISRSAKTIMADLAFKFPLDYEFTIITDGEIIDPGGRPLRIIELDCHSPGNIAILDEKARLIYTGDEVEAGQVLLLPGYAEKAGQIHASPAGTVEECLDSMEKMASFKDHFDAIASSHSTVPLSPVYLEWFAELCRRILDGREQGSKDCSSGTYSGADKHFPFPGSGYRRGQYKGASLVYNKHLLRRSDKVNADKLLPATPLHVMCAWLTPDATAKDGM